MLKLVLLRMKLENVIQSNNVDASCIGRAGLHPNGKGSGRLAMNYISVMQVKKMFKIFGKLWGRRFATQYESFLNKLC